MSGTLYPPASWTAQELGREVAALEDERLRLRRRGEQRAAGHVTGRINQLRVAIDAASYTAKESTP